MKTKDNRVMFERMAAVMIVIAVVLINIKNIFTSCQVDAEYQVAMAYRMVKGDLMFTEMWESHQTSAFYLAFFEFIFLKLAGSTTGILLFSNAVGILTRTAISIFLYFTVKPYVDKRAAFVMLVLGMSLFPKDVMLPDFANLQIWFGILLMCGFIRYFAGKGKRGWLIFGAAALCLQVLSYPGCVLIWALAVMLILLFSEEKGKDVVIFTGTCAVAGVLYLIYFMRGDPAAFVNNLIEIWSGDMYHAVTLGQKLSAMGAEVWALVCDIPYFLLAALPAAILTGVITLFTKKRGEEMKGQKMLVLFFAMFLVAYAAGYFLHLPNEHAGTKYHFYTLYFFVIGAAFYERRRLNRPENIVFLTGQFIGFGDLLATFIMSDSGLFTSIPYMIPGILTAVIPLRKAWAESFGERTYSVTLTILCGLMLFRGAFYINGWMTIPGNIYEDSIFSVSYQTQDGPLKGIVNWGGTLEADLSFDEWREIVNPGDKLLVFSYPMMKASVYLYEDVVICQDSVISTPTYSERLLRYWEQNPDRYPNVVAVKCSNGVEEIGGESAISRWLYEEFQADEVIDTTFWRFYIKNAE